LGMKKERPRKGEREKGEKEKEKDERQCKGERYDEKVREGRRKRRRWKEREKREERLGLEARSLPLPFEATFFSLDPTCFTSFARKKMRTYGG
jgi:hypothetical protein